MPAGASQSQPNPRNPPAPKKGEKNRRNSMSDTPATPATNYSKLLSKGKKKTAVNTPSDDLNLDSASEDSLYASPLKSSCLDPEKCPCNRSTGDYMIDCSNCHQFWHLNCVCLDGLVTKEVNKLMKWRCPFCFVSPVPTTDITVNESCFSCRNTRTLRDANCSFETAFAAEKLKSISSFGDAISKIDFDRISKATETIDLFSVHIQHLLTDKNVLSCMKSLETQINKLNDLLASPSVVPTSDPSQIGKLSSEISVLTGNVHSHSSSFESISDSINKLQSEVQQLATKPPAPSLSNPATDTLLQDISNKLDKLCQNEPDITSGINDLKQSILSIQSAPTSLPPPPPPPLLPPPVLPPLPPDTLLPPPSPEPQHHPHGQLPVSDLISGFITENEAEKLTQYLGSCSFKSEKSHTVISYGMPYDYTGAKSATHVPPMPEELKPILDKINELQSEIYHNKYPEHSKMRSPPPAPVINSCLINRYDGPNSYLPKHSDKEVTIHPESSIFTLSLGQSCAIKFMDEQSHDETSYLCTDRSLYHMTRRSQEVFSHCIEKGSVADVRYSLTFRSVDWRNKNSTCLVGDSNTGQLCFGSCKRSSFGELMPGQRFWAPKIKDIDPKNCMGYSNVVIMCGINDVKSPDVQCEQRVAELYCNLKSKIKQIRKISPKSHVFVCRLLPTKDVILNKKVVTFNRLIYSDLLRTCSGVQCVHGFEKFADHRELLAGELSRTFDRGGFPDMLHLNKYGVRILASLIKRSIFLRIHGGIDKRQHTRRTDGRQYSDVLRDSPPVSRR